VKPPALGDARIRATFQDRDCLVRSVRLIKTYGAKRALDEVDIEVRRGDFFGLVGSNGAGKTTFLRLAASLITPTAGAIYVGGFSTRIWPGMVRRQVGWLPDSTSIHERVRVHVHLEFHALLLRIPPDARRAAVAEALEHVGLADRWAEDVRALSRGMQQRLALARILMKRPEVLLLDEPVSGLDPRSRLEVLDLLRRLNAAGHTLVVSSHILHDLERYCNRIAILEEGTLRWCGPLAEARGALADRMRHFVEVAELPSAAAEALKSLPGVQDAHVDDAHRVPRVCFRTTAPSDDPAGAVALLVERGFRVLQVAREEPTLHDLFLHYTSGRVS